MHLWENILEAVAETDPTNSPLETIETRKTFNAAHEALVKPFKEFSKEKYMEADDLLTTAVTAQERAAFKSGFYAAIDLFLDRA